MSRWKSVTPLVALALVSCGGGSGSSSSTPTPTPVPSPTPAPTPTPTPVATLPAPTIRAYTSAVVAGEYFFESPDKSFFARGFSSRDGFYYPGFVGQMLDYSFTNNPAVPASSDFTTYDKTMEGFDQITSSFVYMTAPPDARVITPLTSMLGPVDQTKLKIQFGIVGTADGLQFSDPDLLTYDAISELQSGSPARQQDAVRMLGFHIRALALGLVLDYIMLGPNPYQGDVAQYSAIGSSFAPMPSRYLFNETDLVAVFKNSNINHRVFRDDVLTAAAHLVKVYGDAMSLDLRSTNIAQYTNGVQGLLIRKIGELFRDNSAAAASAAMAMTSTRVITETTFYAPTLPFPTSGTLFTSTNFYTVKAGQPLTLRQTFAAAPTYDQFSYVPTWDDYRINTDNSSSSQRTPRLNSTSVLVPQAYSGDIKAELQADGTIVITPLSGFQGTAYFDYVGTAPDGEHQTGRAFVTVQP